MEPILKNKYGISSLYPSEWPAEKDVSSDEEDDLPKPSTTGSVRRSNRYSVLERSVSTHKALPGAEKTRDGVENIVQKDEQDPLGAYPSVVEVLRQRGLAVEDDMKLRNRFLLSSTTFSPALFLSQVHNSDSTDSLLQGLDFLSRSIEKKSASLKILVESNFDRFVRAKATIDNVYNEMRNQGQEPESPRRPHSRHASRTSISHARSTSGPLSPGKIGPVPTDKKKNALIKESEYGVQGIKTPLLEVAVKAEEVWGPALGGREKEETLKAILTSVEKHRGVFEVGPAIQDAIKRKDHESIIEEYTRARKYADDAKYLVENANYRRFQLSDVEVHQVIVTARMWSDVESQIEVFKRDAWRRLTGLHFNKEGQAVPEEEGKPEQHIELISIMLQLGVEDNPIWIWLLSRYDFLKNRITSTCERSKVEIEILRRHLANGEKPTARQLSTYMRSVATRNNPLSDPGKMDSAKVLEFWEHVYGSMTTLLSAQGGILAEVIEYWDIARSFISGKAQKNLPVGIDGQSRQHHRLSTDGVHELEKGILELINVIREHLFSFFSDVPIEDISMLFSPLPLTPMTPRTPLSAVLSPLDTRFKFDANNLPPPSPSRGESWEKYAFWPPYSNALSGVHYLSKTLILIGSAASEMASLETSQTGTTDQLRSLVGAVRERCLSAVCAAWNTDADNTKLLEDWTRDPERRDLTNMPNRFMALESFLLSNLQKLAYVSEASGGREGKVEVAVPPSAKLLGTIRSQFVASLYKTLSGMVENAEKGGKGIEDAEDDLTVKVAEMGVEDGLGRIDKGKMSIRLLLTLSTLSTLDKEIIPQLLTQFETSFSVTLTDETAQIKDVLSQIDARLFKAYTSPLCTRLTSRINNGIFSSTWAPDVVGGAADREPSPFVYDVLLDLVIVHTEVSTTATPLTPRILKHLFTHIASTLISSYTRLPTCTLNQLSQATLDVEFISQTLSSYTTEKVSQIQTDIYGILDQKTDNAARVRLQDQLPGLRMVLKRLRESTRSEFACFRRMKRHTVGEVPGGGSRAASRAASRAS